MGGYFLFLYNAQSLQDGHNARHIVGGQDGGAVTGDDAVFDLRFYTQARFHPIHMGAKKSRGGESFPPPSKTAKMLPAVPTIFLGGIVFCRGNAQSGELGQECIGDFPFVLCGAVDLYQF